MSIVAYKYTPGAMSEDELQRTFAARWDTLNYLLEELRKQSHVSTPSSYLMTGSRGAGKSTLLRMLRVKMRNDAKLRGEWLIVPFTEEQHNISSLRDLLAVTLEVLAEQGIPSASNGFGKLKPNPMTTRVRTLQLARSRRLCVSKKSG